MVRHADRKSRTRLVARHAQVSHAAAARLLQAPPADPDADQFALPQWDSDIVRQVLRSTYQQMLSGTIADLELIDASSPPVIRLAQIGRGFMTASYISDRLHWYALIPEPDFFFTVRNACADAVVALGEQAGPHLVIKYPPTRLHGLHDAFGYVMHRAVGLDAVRLAPPMSELGDRLHQRLTDITDDHTALPDIRATASTAAATAAAISCLYRGLL